MLPLRAAEHSRKVRAAAQAAEPVVVQAQAQVQAQVEVQLEARVQVVRAPREPEPADPRVMVAELRGLAAVAAPAMLSAADKALPALRACATRPLRRLAATFLGASRTIGIDQVASNVDHDQVPRVNAVRRILFAGAASFLKLLKDDS
ncbi:hypothetical protein ACVIIV_004503 [Bradyrhizobium sp. USDA 4354]